MEVQSSHPEPGRLSSELDTVLRQYARTRHLAKGEQLYERSSFPDALFCVNRGMVRLSVTSEYGREAVLGLVPPGNWFGEASLFTKEPRGNDAIAVVDSEILLVPAEIFHRLVDSRADFLRQFLVMMGQRYKTALKRLDDTALHPLSARLARLLGEMYRNAIVDGTNPSAVVLKFSQEEAAHMLGVSRQSVNRVIKHWESLGLVATGYRRLTILRPESLGHLAISASSATEDQR